MSETAVKTEKKNDSGMAKLTITLGAICAVCALVLGAVYTATKPYIEANQAAKAAAAMNMVLPADSYDKVFDKATDTARDGVDGTVNAVYQAGDAGYVVEVSPSGSFSGTLTIMVGVAADGSVTGVEVTKTAETSGLGANANKDSFKGQFAGLNESAAVTKDGGSIVAITGATITSRAVCAGVNSAVGAAASMG